MITTNFSGVLIFRIFTVIAECLNEPHHEKICLWAFQPAKTQTCSATHLSKSHEIVKKETRDILSRYRTKTKALIRLQGWAGLICRSGRWGKNYMKAPHWLYTTEIIPPFAQTGCGSSIGSEFAWHASGPEFNPHVRHILSWRLGHENISTAILPSSADSRRAVVSYWRKNVH